MFYATVVCTVLLVAANAFVISDSCPSRISRTSLLSTVSTELGLDDRFDRWRYMQKLLDEETEPDSTNKLIYQVLDGYVKYPRPKFAETEATGSPERTLERLDNLAQILGSAENGSIPLTSVPQQDVTDLIVKLEKLLPDPVEEEDDHKGTWDTVMELHGREAVKYNQMNPTMEWQARCLATRLLLFYDFLILGVVDKPMDGHVVGLSP